MAPTRTRLTEPTDPGVVRFVRLECRDERHDKFYAAVVEADPGAPGAFRCRGEWGRVGGALSTQEKAHGDASLCERALGDLVRSKQVKGYRIVCDERGPFAASAAPATKAPRLPGKSAEVLDEILAERRRDATWAF